MCEDEDEGKKDKDESTLSPKDLAALRRWDNVKKIDYWLDEGHQIEILVQRRNTHPPWFETETKLQGHVPTILAADSVQSAFHFTMRRSEMNPCSWIYAL